MKTSKPKHVGQFQTAPTIHTPKLPKVKMVATTKATLGIGIAAMLIAGPAIPVALADEQTGDDLPTVQIFKKVKDTYASMITYSDEGCVVITMDESSVIKFSTRLARTNFYLIEWKRVGESTYPATSTRSHAVWSPSAGDFLQADVGVQFQVNRKIALAQANVYSGGVTATVPGLFFDQQLEEEPIDDLVFSVTQVADEQVGNISCYVFTRGAMGTTNMLWIGKQDFLIHKVWTVISTKAIRTAASKSRIGPETVSMLQGLTWTKLIRISS